MNARHVKEIFDVVATMIRKIIYVLGRTPKEF